MPEPSDSVDTCACVIAAALAVADSGDRAAARRMGPEGSAFSWRWLPATASPAAKRTNGAASPSCWRC